MRRTPTGAGSQWRLGRVGAGAPPIRMEAGWLEIYHGCSVAPALGLVGAYQGGALLLDKNDPTTVLSRSPGPILAPDQSFERAGFVPNIIFPTGVIRDGEQLLVYCGAADMYTEVVVLSERAILQQLKP